MNDAGKRKMIGQLMVCGFSGTMLNDEFRSFIKEYYIGNIILFLENMQDANQIRKLCSDIQEEVRGTTGYDALICIDQEGGVVSRFPEGIPSLPGAMALASVGSVRDVYDAGVITANELNMLGINVDFAPVADINSNKANPVIGVRSYGDNPESVCNFSNSMMKGLSDGRVIPCIKHFPGHGDTSTDSHLGLPKVNKTYEELSEFELKPFKFLIDNNAPMVMTTHILFPKIDSDFPATMSSKILTGILRKELKYDGVIITDCLEMGAIQENYGSRAGGIHAIEAGADMLCVSHDYKVAKDICDGLFEQVSVEKLSDSFERIIKLKNDFILYKGATGGFDEKNYSILIANAQKRFDELREKSINVIFENKDFFAKSMMNKKQTLFIGCDAFRSTLVSGEPLKINFAKYMGELTGCDRIAVSFKPDDEEIKVITDKIATYKNIILGTYNAYLICEQKNLIQALSDRITKLNKMDSGGGYALAVIAFRNPYDLDFAGENDTKIAAYEYSKEIFDALYRLMMKEIGE